MIYQRKQKRIHINQWKQLFKGFNRLIYFILIFILFVRYIINPLLINGKKFDIRCYMLISSVQPLIILYHEGYIRLSLFDFDPNDQNLLIHLTNQVFHLFHFFQTRIRFSLLILISVYKRKIQHMFILKKKQLGLWNN